MGERKVILIKGDYSKWYDEVIFIVKSNAQIPQSPVAEAERIIKEYIADKYRSGVSAKKKIENQKEIKKVKKFNSKINKAIDVCLVLVLIALAALVYTMLS